MDIRWKQRFDNFEKAFLRLKDALRNDSPSELEKAGVIQYFEFTFELGWKTLKDYLQEMGVEARFPRDTIKEAFTNGLIQDGDLWLDMLEKRNQMSHTYDEFTANQSFQMVRDEFIHGIEQLYTKLKDLR
ncbi:MAG: nucleotidyltransferase substrate binding protein [Tenuifilum sp.]|jgi:nucleotidyltransferase substrate binding protein (TIGR01987 family)|uniref:nucleotidyltransferase substrate binding protein n=1 Tax=Tenuifilum sp. TaxID=2760880 RepID=UPI001B6D0806|nr:nucleotidyltransferase substrate binding protein [Bacteroidales bacterium]HOK60433.1 nucleotidyltransferase substrate binding protein [Tenuifilum sp.]MBP9029918.1 nucleotidyltransferase substrate binding protein [Bacteroidales bacterium]HOK85877.1 nucleotidyltransferase substrate binding protein [Tenuifilum sp.]HON70737.1 nucleotidyltransferase substrate binding protein [Tenuifilum sp.]